MAYNISISINGSERPERLKRGGGQNETLSRLSLYGQSRGKNSIVCLIVLMVVDSATTVIWNWHHLVRYAEARDGTRDAIDKIA
jgi:hypothetical protein